MSKGFWDDVDLSKTMGFAILIYLAGAYYYYNPSVIEKDQVEEIQITLSERPDLSTDSDDNYLRFKAQEYNRPFKLNDDCLIGQIDENKIKQLKVGEKISLIVKTNDLIDTENRFVNNFTEIYGLNFSNINDRISLSDYNLCKKNSWRIMIFLSIVLIVLLIIDILKKYRKT